MHGIRPDSVIASDIQTAFHGIKMRHSAHSNFMAEPFKLKRTISFLSFLLDSDVINRTTFVTLQIV